MSIENQIRELSNDWKNNPYWQGITRPYQPEDVIRLRGSIQIDHTLARMGAEKLRKALTAEPFVRALGALTGNQAIQQVQAGLKAIYISGWQVAGDANTALEVYPDQSLYPVDSVPVLIRKINKALMRADQIQHMAFVNQGFEKDKLVDYFVPILADAEAGFGGPLNTFELTKAMIEAGTAALHLEDQLSSLKKCGHMGGKVLIPAGEYIQKLAAARMAADVLGVPTIIVARTDAEDAELIRSDSDDIDKPFLTGKRSYEGYLFIKGGTDMAIQRGIAYAPYADMIWCETKKPDLNEAKAFADGIHEKFPGKALAYNCSPSFNWKRNMDESQMRHFQEQLGEMGYKFQFVTLAGFHTLNESMYDLAYNYNREGMAAYSRLQEHEFEMEREQGYKAVKHQSFVGAGYFDELTMILTERQSATTALKGSTEEDQFVETASSVDQLEIDETVTPNIGGVAQSTHE
jgi:isocitrate lyase